jgi:hypothetical protein
MLPNKPAGFKNSNRQPNGTNSKEGIDVAFIQEPYTAHNKVVGITKRYRTFTSSVGRCRTATVVVVVVVVVWGPESGCTAACRLIVHTPCVFNVPTFTARRLHITTTLEILAAKCGTCWARNVRQFGRKKRVPRYFTDLLHAAHLRHGTDSFTSPPKEVVLGIFSP